MASLTQTDAEITNEVHVCDQCGKPIKNGRAFAFNSKAKQPSSEGMSLVKEITKCFPCALQHRPMLRRSLTAAVIVGTVLTILNQGDILILGKWNSALYWKIPLTYCVPMMVATYGALTNNRK